MSDHCGSITEEGSAVCVPGACSCASETQNNSPIPLSLPSVDKYKSAFGQFFTELKKAISYKPVEEKNHVEENS
jgi:hypothetical protein